MHKYSKDRLGFSLMEVLVALAIFAIAIAVLAQAVNNAIRGLELVKHDQHQAQLYRFGLRQILRLEERDEVEDGGKFETPEDGSIDWSAEVEETEILDLFELKVEMSLEGQEVSVFDDKEGVHLETLYVYRPTWSDSLDRESLLQDKQDALEQERLNPR